MFNEMVLLITQRLFVCVVFLAFSGCANLYVEPYGHVTPDREEMSPGRNRAYLPLNAPSISQGYKPERKDVFTFDPRTEKEVSIHEGIDILFQSGTPVLATADGVIVDSYFEPFYGNRVTISHGKKEDGRFYKSNYFHLKKRFVKKGDIVKRGQQIGTLGMTGLLSAGFSHLHFEIRTAHQLDQRLTIPQNPHKFWADGIGKVTCYDKSKNYPEESFKTTYPVPCYEVDWR